MIKRNINYLDVANCMYNSECASKGSIISRLLFDAFNDIHREFDDALRNKGIYVCKKDPDNENSDIYIVHNNHATVYKSTIKNILKIADLAERTKLMTDVTSVLHSDDPDAEIRKFNKEYRKIKLTYIDTVYELEKAGSIDKLKLIITEHISDQLKELLGWHRILNCADNDVMFMDNNSDVHGFECNFKNLSEIARHIKTEKRKLSEYRVTDEK